MRMRSKVFTQARTNDIASVRKMDTLSRAPKAAMFFVMAFMHCRDLSTKVTESAPLLNASIPNAPLPEKRSSTSFPCMTIPRAEKMAPFTISVVGLIPSGHSILRDLYWPAPIRSDIIPTLGDMCIQVKHGGPSSGIGCLFRRSTLAQKNFPRTHTRTRAIDLGRMQKWKRISLPREIIFAYAALTRLRMMIPA